MAVADQQRVMLAEPLEDTSRVGVDHKRRKSDRVEHDRFGGLQADDAYSLKIRAERRANGAHSGRVSTAPTIVSNGESLGHRAV